MSAARMEAIEHGNAEHTVQAILAIDQATRSGLCYMNEDNIEKHWTLDLSKYAGNRPMILYRFQKAIRKAIEEETYGGVDMLIYEIPYTKNAKTALITYGLAGIVELTAASYEILVAGVHPGTLKKFATGNGRADKLEMVRAAEERGGITVANDDEADAYWLAKLWGDHLWGDNQWLK